MSSKVLWALFLASAFIPAATSDADAQGPRRGGGDWERLGCVEVGRRTDRDVIEVGRREGRFRAIRLEVSGNDVDVQDLKVVYANGQPDDIRVRSELREGTQTRPLDLKGRDRAIARIEIVSRRDFKGRGRGRARICVAGLESEGRRGGFGRRDDDRGRRADWEELGCQKVGFLKDRDAIRVGRREGRFKAIRLEVTGNDVHVDSLTVVYANGEPDRIPVRSNIRENSRTEAYDLKGRRRSIDRIEMVYRARPNFRGSARVCVAGLQ